MGEVYLGEKIGPEGFVKPVVLKCVLPQLTKDRAFVQLFLDEARLAALLNHPNIAQVYDFGLVDDVYFIAMEYVPGYTVDDVRRKLKSIGQFMPVEHVAQIASQVCQGLHYAHTLSDGNGVCLGLVHRDVSPHNLIISVDGSVKIVDFGIAKARAGLTRVQARGAVGKFGYMSPEQSRGEVVDGRSDVFSLGICLWELATNERLHEPQLDRPPDYSPAHPVRSPEVFRRDMPRQFLQIVEQSLAIEAADRFSDCKQMHLQLERFLAAMTHFAGQSALAEYIKALSEGLIEHPEERATGIVVEPAQKHATVRARATVRSQPSALESMEAAQKYEEVFGVTMESPNARPRLTAVPRSWETRARSTPSPLPGASVDRTTQAVDEEMGLDLVEQDRAPRRPVASGASMTPVPTPKTRRAGAVLEARRPRPVRFPIVRLLLMFGLAAAGLAAGYVERERLASLLRGAHPEPELKLTSVYRIESEPPDAEVWLDGRLARARTPVELELIPEVEYVIRVRKKGFGTAQSRLKASIGSEIRPLRFTLPEAATLQVITVPPGARVTVNGQPIEDLVTPLEVDDVPAGMPLRVVASITGRPDAAETVEIPPGKKKTVRLSISKH
ncbi:MAG: serine/threonine protein kinase [Deltaproteobacteria bacterium]|nr:serine/threonine protein kinase [Deltaproteobacteria bacterium]